MTSPIEYVARGWPVFPCHSIERGKCTCKLGLDCHDPGKHPLTQHGFKAATTDLNMINGWLKSWPNANWALRTGSASGILVCDIDPRHDGFQSFAQLQQARGPMPDTLRSKTGGGGRHLFYAIPPGLVIPKVRGWLPGVDIQAEGSYVVLPESRHKSGTHYRWINWEEQPTLLPPDIISMIMSKPASSGGGMTGDLGSTSDILMGVPEGERDDVLFRFACRLRRQVGDDGRRIVELAVLEAAARCSPPFPPEQALRKVAQAWAQDHDDSVVDWQMGVGKPRDYHPLTDLGNAHRFYDAFGSDMLYVEGWGWLVWTEIGWQHDAQGIAPGLTHQLSNLILDEARELEQQGTDIKIITHYTNWAKRSQSAATMHNALAVAKDIQQMRRTVDHFDAKDHEIVCRNRIVDLRTGEVRSIGKDDLVTKNTNVEYDPTFRLDEWDRFIWETCNGDLETIAYLQRAAGYTATGSNQEEKLFLISGPPASGKSTFLDGLETALGSYATTTSPDTFMWSRTGQPPTVELARMAGVRMVAMSEIKEGSGFNENLIKAVTGGERITGKRLYEMPFTYLPRFALWIGTNHDPAAYDDALWRRIAKIPFPNALPPERRDPRLKILLRDPEKGGKAVLAWLVAGAVAWYQYGLMQPLSVTTATYEYHQEQDQPQSFINDCVRWVDGINTPRQAAFSAYRIWCEHVGIPARNRVAFARMMRERGFKTIMNDSGQESYIGISVSTPFVGNNMFQ
jgi:putative DNA primase/helicase